MKPPRKLCNFLAPAALIDAAHARAQQNCQTVSAVLRQYLEAYIATQPLKGTK
jgi:hypothetical protein